MPNFVESNLLAAQAKFSQKFSEQELRRKQNPALMLALQNLTATIPDHMQLRTREDRAVKAYLFKRRAASSNTARAARPTGTKGNSVEVPLTWQTIAETFKISMKQGDNNVFAYQEMLMNEMLQAAQNIHDRLGTTFLNYLITNKNQLPVASPQGATWNATPDNYEVAAANSTYFFQMVASIMKQHYYRGQLDVIADSTAFQKAQQLRAQGAQNATNLTFQFDDLNIVNTTEQVLTGYSGSCLAMPAGAFAALPWIPKQNREGRGDYESYNGGYGTMADPLGASITGLDADGNVVNVPLTYSVYAFTEAADDNAANGYTQDQVTTFEISIDVAPTLAPVTGANESVVNGFGQLAS
jgi:hypothetical protein